MDEQTHQSGSVNNAFLFGPKVQAKVYLKERERESAERWILNMDG